HCRQWHEESPVGRRRRGGATRITSLSPRSATPEHWFDPRAYKMPIAGTFGNAGRSSIRGPALFNVDTSLFKRIPIRESVTLQFRAEAFNVFNRTNLGLPNQVVFTGNTSSYNYSEP